MAESRRSRSSTPEDNDGHCLKSRKYNMKCRGCGSTFYNDYMRICGIKYVTFLCVPCLRNIPDALPERRASPPFQYKRNVFAISCESCRKVFFFHALCDPDFEKFLCIRCLNRSSSDEEEKNGARANTSNQGEGEGSSQEDDTDGEASSAKPLPSKRIRGTCRYCCMKFSKNSKKFDCRTGICLKCRDLESSDTDS